MLKTEIEKSTFKGSPVISIWEVKEDGTRKDFPLISFGKKKAEEIVKHIDEIKSFVEGE